MRHVPLCSSPSFSPNPPVGAGAAPPVLGQVLLLAGMARSWPQPFAGMQGNPSCCRPSSTSTRGPAPSSPFHIPFPASPSYMFTRVLPVSRKGVYQQQLCLFAFSERLTSSHLLRAGAGCVPFNSGCGTSLTLAYC